MIKCNYIKLQQNKVANKCKYEYKYKMHILHEIQLYKTTPAKWKNATNVANQ